jgi:hypothetical protein
VKHRTGDLERGADRIGHRIGGSRRGEFAGERIRGFDEREIDRPRAHSRRIGMEVRVPDNPAQREERLSRHISARVIGIRNAMRGRKDNRAPQHDTAAEARLFAAAR